MTDEKLLPCPWCQEDLDHVETWARSFDPPRAYHEYHHRNTKCVMGWKIWVFTPELEIERGGFIRAWNTRHTQNLPPAQGDLSYEDHQKEMAEWLGAPSVGDMNLTHDRFHKILCKWLRIESWALNPSLQGTKEAEYEELAVLHLQRFLFHCDPELAHPLRTGSTLSP
jgi:hypothetical protein